MVTLEWSGLVPDEQGSNYIHDLTEPQISSLLLASILLSQL